MRKVLGKLIAIFCATVLSSSCGNDMEPLPQPYCATNPRLAHIILVARALEDCHPIGPLETSRWNGRPVQLYRVKVRVEKMLKGEPLQSPLDIYYFVDQGSYTGSVGHATDIRAGHSEVFLLEKDRNILRTVCDGWRSCILWVRTGTHYRFVVDPYMPVEQTISNLMLSRGEETTDEQLIDVLFHPDIRWGWKVHLESLEQLKKSERSPQVRPVLLEKIREVKQIVDSPYNSNTSK